MVDSNGYIVDNNKNFVYGYRIKDDGSGVDTTKLERLRIPTGLTITPGTAGNPGSTDIEFEDDENALLSTAIEINAMGQITATVQVEETDATTGKTVKNSKTVEIGQLAIAIFQNPNGLTKAGGNYYTTTEQDNAGQVVAGQPGDAGISTLMTGYIEASNVDLAKEFADMITTHRGFQANSKMITVSDEMLSDLVAMKR